MAGAPARAGQVGHVFRWLTGPPENEIRSSLWPRWFLLRGLGICFLSVFVSLWFQFRGLIGEHGILPATDYLRVMSSVLGPARFWQVPTVLWWGSGDGALLLLCADGLVASAMLVLNVWPRVAVAACTAGFLSFAVVLQRFSSFQTDGLLMEAGFIAIFYAPAGRRPGLGAASPPSRLARFALLWVFFRIYFESGIAKVRNGDPEWAALTAMDHYYETGPLPTVLAWYAQKLVPHAFHAATSFLTLAVELVFVWGAFLPRTVRIILFCCVTPFQLSIIATANYGCLNYLVLTLGLVLLDDGVFSRVGLPPPGAVPTPRRPVWQFAAGVFLGWQLYATATILLRGMVPLPYGPVTALTPFRVVNGFGLFGEMMTEHIELEFQGSDDGHRWAPYRFRYKPQDPRAMPGFFAPYQARFDLALVFAAIDGNWHHNDWVVHVEERLLAGSPDVLDLFLENPYPEHPPSYVRLVAWRYVFSSPEQRRADGSYWQRDRNRPFAPMLHKSAAGQVDVVETP